jgi:hypothetical protein
LPSPTACDPFAEADRGVNIAIPAVVPAARADIRSGAADTPVCTGKDMICDSRQGQPGAARQDRAGSRRDGNGKGLLWKIETQGSAPSYLFGTMAYDRSAVTKLTLPAQHAR